MRNGRFNRPGELFAVTQTYNDAGDETQVETKECDYWVQFVSGMGREFTAASQQNADVTHVMRGRYLPGTTVTPNHIWKGDGKTYRFTSAVNEQDANKTLLITAIEDVSEEV